ncbi:MAG: NAD+ synthase [Planctomycetota bacterium]
MRIGICQIDQTVGDFAGNIRKIAVFARRARAEGANLAAFPELAVSGYPPEDLLRREAFLAAHDAALQELASLVPPDLPVLVGCLERNDAARTDGGRALYNAAALLEDGIARFVARKTLLPTYDVFDESRYFEPCADASRNVVTIAGSRIGIVICEDGWNDEHFFERRVYSVDPVAKVVEAGAEIVVNLSASPWDAGKERLRWRMVAAASRRHGIPILYVNQVGGNIDMQFDGASLAAKPEGVAFQPVCFEEDLFLVDTNEAWDAEPRALDLPEMHRLAIVQGIRAYSAKFGFPKAVVGLSGGIDSALVAALAADALGPDKVTGIAMPSEHSSSHSLEDAESLARNLGIGFCVIPISDLQRAFAAALREVFAGTEPGVAEENLQARTRGVILMAYANKHGHLLLTTGNKSECAVGYCTLYGDMCGALAPIADLWKTEVYALASHLNRTRERIPRRTIEKPPSAELRPGQLDTDSLPPYEVLDPVLRSLVEQERSVEETAALTGTDRNLVAELQRRVVASEFKRYQYAPALRLSERCWGGRRMPVAHRFEER